MKKIWKFTFGGLEQKIFNLVLITIVLIVGAYTAVLLYQAGRIRELTAETADEQNEAVQNIASGTLVSVIEESLSGRVNDKAAMADAVFHDMEASVRILAEKTKPLLSDPSSYGAHRVNRPKAENDGTPVMQLLTEAGVDLKDRDISRMAGVLGNLQDIMTTLYEAGKADSFFVAAADGLCVILDARSGEKFDEDGTVRPFPFRIRPWYRGAIKSGDIFFTDLQTDTFSGRTGIVCAMPVYVDGKTAAVVGADLFLDSMPGEGEGMEQGRFSFAVNQDGKVIYSPVSTGIFAVEASDTALDLRQSDEAKLAAFVSDALENRTDVELVPAEGHRYYMAGAPLPTVGWCYIYAVDEALTQASGTAMAAGLDSIHEKALAKLGGGIRSSLRTILVLLLVITFCGSAAAVSVSRRIVRPLNTMTGRIAGLDGTDLAFEMEDCYRTDDEIEVLAEAFASLSARTLRYIREITGITAEKERISTELNMAKSIQGSQLPNIFPPYPQRPEFDIYASMTPAREVGGDFYDFFLIDDSHLGMVIADVSGKSVPAALYMMVSRILIKNRLQDGSTPEAALANVNAQLMESNTNMFVTVWLCVLDITTGQGIVSNAGHEHPVLRRAGGPFALVRYKHSPAIGVLEGLRFPSHEFQMNPGDTLFVYTDGVAEAANAGNELFGNERMLESLNKDPDASPEKLLHRMLEDVDAFKAGAEQFDDITMLCLKYYGPEKTA